MKNNNHPYLMLALFVVSIVPWAIIGIAPRAMAQTPDVPCEPPPYPPEKTIPLAPRIAERQSTTVPRTFYISQTVVTLQGSERICLASSEDGSGALRVDDILSLRVIHPDRTRSEWSRNYHDPQTGGIAAGPAQDVSTLFSPGSNDISVELIDWVFNRYSTEPIWLVIWQIPTQVTTPTTQVTPTALISQTPTTTETPPIPATPVQTETQPIPIQTPTQALGTPTSAPPLPSSTPTSGVPGKNSSFFALLVGGLAALLILAVWVANERLIDLLFRAIPLAKHFGGQVYLLRRLQKLIGQFNVDDRAGVFTTWRANEIDGFVGIYRPEFVGLYLDDKNKDGRGMVFNQLAKDAVSDDKSLRIAAYETIAEITRRIQDLDVPSDKPDEWITGWVLLTRFSRAGVNVAEVTKLLKEPGRNVRK
jgi:hypothetical protein